MKRCKKCSKFLENYELKYFKDMCFDCIEGIEDPINKFYEIRDMKRRNE